MNKKVKVLVLGTGFAGQGHTEAFRTAGAEVVGIVGRTESVLKEVAEKLNIPFASTSWVDALYECKPDIVSIATPGGAHFRPIMEAIEAGCHVFCDKPLAESGENAEKMYKKAEEKGVKTAFAASYRYMPCVQHAKRLIEQGVIGEPTEAEFISHFNLEKEIPYGWSHSAAQGGGRLNNNFSHMLSIATNVIGEKVLKITGEVRDDLHRAPIVKGVHNFKTRRNFIPKDLNDPSIEWGESDVEWSYTVLAKIESDYPSKQPVSILFKHGGIVPRFNEDHIVFYGTEGAIYIKGHYGHGPLFLSKNQGEWKELETPADIIERMPDIEDDTQRNWTILAENLVNDVKGEKFEKYQSFYDGYRYQKIVDLIRKNCDWTDVTSL